MEILILAAILGLIPAAIAHSKGRSFALWWLYGAALWIVALPHAILIRRDEEAIERRETSASGGKKKCPFCAELIKTEARVCRFCGRDLASAVATAGSTVCPFCQAKIPAGAKRCPACMNEWA